MASMSKRQQARNERELHALLSAPGNSQCADCSAKNPAWASWNLGIFLCMRCASIHRKLGTHISKVKSLSMDTWTADQVENMKQTGNIASNHIYNPKNKKADMPLDADEVDSAMERFIRKKYQEKSLLDGRPAVPRRDNTSPTTYSRPQDDFTTYSRPQDDSTTYSRPQDESPPPLPPKKGKFFGFGLRASSSSLPLSKHDKKKLPKKPRVDSTFHIPNDDYNSMSRMADARHDMSDAELQQKLATLRDMGFTETERNADLLRRLHGNVERTIERLVQLGPSKDAKSTARPEKSSSAVLGQKPSTAFPDVPAPQSSEPSYNPFTQMTNQPPVGLSLSKPQEASSPTTQNYASNNPFGQVVQPQVQPQQQPQPQIGLEQSFQSMQLAQPLFPHSTGGYPIQPPPLQDPRFQYSMTPPAISTPYQQNYAASPSALTGTNPFYQPSPASAHSTGSNPFFNQSSQNPAAAGPPSPSVNPFFSLQATSSGSLPQQPSNTASYNPFGIPPPQSPIQAGHQLQNQGQPQDIFGTIPSPQSMQPPQPLNPFQTQPAQQSALVQQQYANAQNVQNVQTYPSLQYGQLQSQPQSQPQPQPQPQQLLQSQSSFQAHTSPFQQQFNQQPQIQTQQSPFQQSYGQQPQSLSPQQTGRYDKNSIMALFNQPLASIPEPTPENAPSQQFYYPQQQQVSPAPVGDVFGAPNNMNAAKRSATMPISLQSMHSAGGGGNRNPFLMNNTSATANAGNNPGLYATNFTPTVQGQTIAARHASAESMSISNLESGRHSPDAFASLSARHMR